jgi:hypothetical protein
MEVKAVDMSSCPAIPSSKHVFSLCLSGFLALVKPYPPSLPHLLTHSLYPQSSWSSSEPFLVAELRGKHSLCCLRGNFSPTSLELTHLFIERWWFSPGLVFPRTKAQTTPSARRTHLLVSLSSCFECWCFKTQAYILFHMVTSLLAGMHLGIVHSFSIDQISVSPNK